MQKLSSSQIREAFLAYFASQGHYREKSASLVPLNDPTLLFTSAGMVQFKDVFMGMEKRSYTRATTAQKCLRAGGKHNDLENVGFTGRHHTFFEMLGNFSFGDYFKKEAIHFAWDFVTNVLKLPKDKLYVTVFREDDEAFKIWHEQEGVPTNRILRFDEKDNFWAAGDVGPCGPCSEIYFDQGEAFNTGDPEKDRMGGDGDRFLEFYNLVFMQYNRDASGNLSPLPRPSVDTGMGLERISGIIQGARTNYDTDGFQILIRAIAAAAGRRYDPAAKDKQGQADVVAMRVIADHLRATSFLLADGVLPSNEGRGYVLRRILRRAVRFGKNLGFHSAFMESLVPALVQWMGEAYPELKEKEAFIRKAMKAEEENFFATLERGLALLEEKLSATPKGGTLSGETAFLLHDSFGFPLDLTRLIAKEQGRHVDEAGFELAMDKQKSQSKVVAKAEKGSGQGSEIFKKWSEQKLSTQYAGYHALSAKGNLLALELGALDPATKQQSFQAIFSHSPFYAEGGGQAGDSGEIFSGNKKIATVTTVKKPLPELQVVCGILEPNSNLSAGQEYDLRIPERYRRLVAANHSATHLLHWALKEVLGGHVKQAGSLVNAELLRFDFTHFSPLSEAEKNQITHMVNEKILLALPLKEKVMSKDAAISSGAVALFGEKYDDDVRVIGIGDGFSTELCGGTHVTNTAEIRLFMIASEGGVAAGVRRIVAYTNDNALQYLMGKTQLWDGLREKLKANSDEDISKRIDKALQNEKDLERKLAALQAQSAGALAKDLLAKKKTSAQGIPCILQNIGEGSLDSLRVLGDSLRSHFPSGVIALAASEAATQKAALLVLVSADLTAKCAAGKLVQAAAPLFSGKGGGKPEQAQAGGTNPAGLPEALEKIFSLL